MISDGENEENLDPNIPNNHVRDTCVKCLKVQSVDDDKLQETKLLQQLKDLGYVEQGASTAKIHRDCQKKIYNEARKRKSIEVTNKEDSKNKRLSSDGVATRKSGPLFDWLKLCFACTKECNEKKISGEIHTSSLKTKTSCNISFLLLQTIWMTQSSRRSMLVYWRVDIWSKKRRGCITNATES